MEIDIEFSPAVSEALVFGRPTRAGLAATLVTLAGKGFVVFGERENGRHTVEFRPAGGRSREPMTATEEWLLSTLRTSANRRGALPAWSQWKAALGREAAAHGALTVEQWTTFSRWSLIPMVSRRIAPKEKARRARALAERLRRYPNPETPLPNSRSAWDRTLSYAVGLRQGHGFLKRVREVNEYYARHFQGVVMTFYTPPWYAPLRVEGRDRFAFLTAGMSQLLNHFSWDRLDLT